MGDTTGSSDKAENEKIIRQLQGHFWPLCGMIGGVLLFFIAAVTVPP